MRYFRNIFSCLILFLISIILIANQSPTASGFETQGATGPTSFDLGLPVHQDITREGLSFLKSDSLESIVSQHIKIEQDPSSPNHFDNCQFAETVSRINLRYDAAISNLNPDAANLPLAEEDFGYILHAAQDFYAHTNWVEMGRSDLIDPWLGHWRPLYGYTLSSNTHPVFILEENGKSNSDFQIYKNGKVIIVNHEMWDADGSGKKMGLISGTYDADVSKCPASASIPHGGKISTGINHISPFATDESRDLPDELNKDNPAMRGFWTARTLAVQQTTHEFCRLLDLEKITYGDKGVKFINDHWVQPQYLIDSPANNSRCPTSDSTVSMIRDSPTSVEDKVVSIPSWVKRNAQYWSDGSLNDKDFATGIGYLVQKKIISANVATNKDGTIVVNENLSIPKWIKNNAKYWSEGSISDSDFKSGIEFMVNQNIISFSEPVQKQGVISKDDLKSLYKISKQYERTATSILTLNDNQEKALQGLTTSDWNKNTKDPKNAVHVKVLDLLIKKQDFDKQNIQHVVDTTNDISNKIKDYALKQGVSSSELDKISGIPLKNQNSGNTPISVLKQSADDVKNNVAAVKNDEYYKDRNEKASLAFALSDVLGSDESLVEKFRLGYLDFDWTHGYSYDLVHDLLDNHSKELTAIEITFLNRILEEQKQKISLYSAQEEERSKQHVLDLMQQAIDLLQKEEQGETGSILNYISDPTLKDLSASEGNHNPVNPIQLQSKHGTYDFHSTSGDGSTDMYFILSNWVLKSQNGVEHATAHVLLTKNGASSEFDLPIKDGVIQNAIMGTAGTYVFKLVNIDGLAPPDDNTIEIIIPRKGVSSETPSTVQTTPPIPNTPLTQNTMDFSVPPQIVQEATSSTGAIVHFTISASSPGGNMGIVICVPSDGSLFPLGSTTVTCTATDVSSQKTLKKSFTVIVRDTTPPAISPFNPHNDTPDDSGAIVYFTMEAIDLVDGSITPHCDHTSGSKFPLGSTIVTCTADDSKGNHSERKLGITITKS